MGIYFLPFIGMQIPETFDWTPNNWTAAKLGMGGGFRIGKKMEKFFMEADFGHYRKQI